jgi:hypothetical protein
MPIHQAASSPAHATPTQARPYLDVRARRPQRYRAILYSRTRPARSGTTVDPSYAASIAACAVPPASMIWKRRRSPAPASDTSIQAPLEPVKLFESMCKGGCDIGSRFLVQPLWLDQPSTSGRIPEGASQVPCGLGVVVGALPTGRVTSCDSQPSESDVIHDHTRLGQHQIGPITCIGVRISARHVKHTGTVGSGETVCGSSCSSQLSTGGGSSEMINDSCSDANREVLIKGVGENLLPTAQPLGLRRPCLLVATPGTRASHTYLYCDLGPAQASITKLQDLLCGGGMGRRAATTHGDAGPPELLDYRGPAEVQLGSDLAYSPALGV